MSSLHITILFTLLTIIIADNKASYFTKANYELWCYEDFQSSSLFLYSNHIPIGIYHTSNIKTVTYNLIDDDNNGLFQIRPKRIADFYFVLVNITRPFDINREYQDAYTLRIEAHIVTTHENRTEQAQIRLYVADSNDNDAVFDVDIYERNYTQSTELDRSLIQFRASDADEIQNAQIFYELATSSNDTYSLHPYTGELYLITKDNLKSSYEFDIYAYDRHRQRTVDHDTKTKARVKLNFHDLNSSIKTYENIQTIFNQTIHYEHLLTTYEISIFERKLFHLLNLHQPIITIQVKSYPEPFEIFLLKNSSSNSRNLFIHKNHIYLNKYIIEEYNLQLLICFNNRSQCQYKNYRYIPLIDFNVYQFHLKSMETIYLDENLPIDSFITRVRVDHKKFSQQQSMIINYKISNDDVYYQFYMDSKTGIIRLAERLNYRTYLLDIEADIHVSNRRYSIGTTIQINVREINKHRPMFRNNTPTDLFQLPYQFEAYDNDQNKQTNGRVTYRLWNCWNDCPFQIDSDNGTLSVINKDMFNKEVVYNLQVIAFDWGQPISLQTSLDIRIDLSTRLTKRSLPRTRVYSRRSRKTSPSMFLTTTETTPMNTEKSTHDLRFYSNADTIYLNVGFQQNTTTYHLSEDAELNTIIDRLKIEYDSLPLNIDDNNDNLFFYTINDTTVPFRIDQNEKLLIVNDKLDREKHYKYTFEIELKLKSIYAMKLQEQYACEVKNSLINIQYTNQYYQKMIVLIYVDDINDNVPMCNDYHDRIELNENEIRKTIYQVQAFDPDLGENGTLIYSLFNYNEYFSINSNTGEIDCIKSIDYEEHSSIDLHIIVSDQGSQVQHQSICMTIHIIIKDINDNTPRFLSNNYTFDLFADTPRHTVFAQIDAIDDDKNDRITYAINQNPYIIINTFTGHLRLRTSLLRSSDQRLNLTVEISDGLHRNQTMISIVIKQFPDAQKPILLPEPAYSRTINESLPVDSSIINIYQRLRIERSTIDFIEIIHDDIKLPFSIDQQGSVRLTRSLIGLTRSSYWLRIRLTRYRAHPPHTYFHLHVSIRPENFYLPQCVNTFQNVKAYEYAIEYPFARVEVESLNKNSLIQYSIQDNENIFLIDKRTGFVQLSSAFQNNRRVKSHYLLTINAFDSQYKFSANCYLKVQLIRRQELKPKFLSSAYSIDLPEISSSSGRLFKRLFQIVALLDTNVYDGKLAVRYKFVNPNQHFIINRQTGYIAAKQPLNPLVTYEFQVQATTVAYRHDVLPDGNENDDDEHLNQGKWRVVSYREISSVKVRVLPMVSLNRSLVPNIDSTVNVDLLKTTKVGSLIVHLGMNNRFNQTQWFIMTGSMEHTQYFHVDIQTGHLILIRPIEELMELSNIVELGINVTTDWVNMNTIKIILRIIDNPIPKTEFTHSDYYISLSKSISIGAEVARLTIENPSEDCTYLIDSVERIKSFDLFRINPRTGAITLINALISSPSQTHLLKVVYRCQHIQHVAHTNLHITVIDGKTSVNQTNNSYRFIQDSYLIIFETSLIQNQRKYLMDFVLVNYNSPKLRIQPKAKIVQGDPLGLFGIDSSTQSLVLLDESQARSYIYPIKLTIIDTSQDDLINTTVTVLISNIGIHFPCPSYLKHSPYIFTYGNHRDQSLIVRGFDPFTPLNGEASNQAECFISSKSNEDFDDSIVQNDLNFIFHNEFTIGYINHTFGFSSFVYNNQYEPIDLKIKRSFNITYHLLLNQIHKNLFQLDEYAGLIKYHSFDRLIQNQYSLIVYAKYNSLITFTRLNVFIQHRKMMDKPKFQYIYEFKLYTPFVNNYTIGYINKQTPNLTIVRESILPMISIDKTGRLFVNNRTLLLMNGNFYDFLIQDDYSQVIRVQVLILPPREQIYECTLNYLNNHKRLIGFIEITNINQSDFTCYQTRNRIYQLLNYNHLFALDSEHGLLYNRYENQTINENLLLLIQIDNSRCLITVDKTQLQTSYIMIRYGSELYNEITEKYAIDKSSGQIKLANNTLLNYDIVSTETPVFSKQNYEFSLNLTHTTNERVFVGQTIAQSYDSNRSHVIYKFVNRPRHFHIDPDYGIIEFIPNRSYNKTIEQFQVLAYDLIYNRTILTDVTIRVNQQEPLSYSSLIYEKTVSNILPPGALIFQPNITFDENLQYNLEDHHHSNVFEINSTTGEVRLVNYLTDKFYSFKIHVTPIEKSFIIKLNVTDYNQHAPKFYNQPSNLSLSLSNEFVTKISAYDFNLNDNAKLEYSFLNIDDEKYFSINQTNGIICLIDPLFNKASVDLSIGVTDGLYLTKTSLEINFYNYSKHMPKFSSAEYLFYYEQSNDILGHVVAYDLDINDRITYELYLQPNEISIDKHTGAIKIEKNFTLNKSLMEFYASAKDLAQQIVYTKVKMVYTIEPKFRSYIHYISVDLHKTQIPSEIYQFDIVDLFNQPLKSVRYQIKNQTNQFDFTDNKLMLKNNTMLSNSYLLNINAYWKNFILQSYIHIQFLDNFQKLNKTFYEFSLERTLLTEHFLIETFPTYNSTLNMVSTPLTRYNCMDNFYIKKNQLFFKSFPILSSLCFFDLHFINIHNSKTIYSSQIKINFIDSYLKPTFSSAIYYFVLTNKDNHLFRVFATSANTIQYRLQNNTYGLVINEVDGSLTFKHGFDLIADLSSIKLNVYAIEEKTLLNDTALLHITLSERQQFELPTDYEHIPSCPNLPIVLSDQSLPGTVIQDIRSDQHNIPYNYYVLSGDKYGLFAINHHGQLYLTSSMLNKTTEEYFELTILIASSSQFYCRTNISVIRTPNWSYFICPIIPIEWIVEEESPVGTVVGTVKHTLTSINNIPQLIDNIYMKLNQTNVDAQAFLLNSHTGTITSNSRLDYELKTTYSFSILLEPDELNCSIPVLIKLINTKDNTVDFDSNSLIYHITENNNVPYYVGRIHLLDIDQLYLNDYEFYLKNKSIATISIDQITGSIVLHDVLDREHHGSSLEYDILAIDNNNQENVLSSKLTFHIIDINDHGPKFDNEYYSINISKSTRPDTIIFQVNATSRDPIVNGDIIYNLMNASEYFSINQQTGIIRLKNFLPASMDNITLNIRAFEHLINLTDSMNLLILINNDDNTYFDIANRNNCSIEENQILNTEICTIGWNSNDFIYELIDDRKYFHIYKTNGTIINKKIFDYETDQHDYNVTIVVKDRDNQSIVLSSLNLTIFIRNINDNYPEFITKNFTTVLYLFHPLMNTIVHRIEAFDKDQSTLLCEILNDTYSSYRLQPFVNHMELTLIDTLNIDRDDNLIIRLWDTDKSVSSYYIDLYIRLIYIQANVEYPTIIPKTIDGYVNFDENSSGINFGDLVVQNQSTYKFIYFNLINHKYFFLKQISNNQTELYFHPNQRTIQQTQQQNRPWQFYIELNAIALSQPVPELDFSNDILIRLPQESNSLLQSRSIEINLWPIDREMLHRSLSITINMTPQSTYQQFIIYSLPFIRESLASVVGVEADHVHIYTFGLQAQHQIELLVSILRHPSNERPPRYLQKKLLYNTLKNSSSLLEQIKHVKSVDKILTDPCHVKSCDNNGRCTSHIKLTNQYEYFYYNSYQRLVPKYQWNFKCSCLSQYHGPRCEYKQNYESPCSSNPCSPLQRCIEKSATLYDCQCIDEPCTHEEVQLEDSLECININSPTCRDSSNTLTFDGYGFARLNGTFNFTQHTSITFTFRTQVEQGKLIKLISYDEKNHQHLLLIHIKDGHIHFQLNRKILFQFNEIYVNDSLWHHVYFSIDYIHNQNTYYLLRLDNVFSHRIHLTKQISLNYIKEFSIGNDFHGCLGNLTINNQTIYLQKQPNSYIVEHMGMNYGCQLTEMETRTLRQFSENDDICSVYQPCYHGGVCSSRHRKHGVSFSCSCLKPRFAGRQCQYDLQPCLSYPCTFNEQCISSSSPLDHSNISYTCISSLINLPMSMKNPLYFGIALLCCTSILIVLLCLSLIIYCQQRRKDKKRKISVHHDKPLVSAPLLVHKSSPAANAVESPMQTLLKMNNNGKPTVETMALIDENPSSSKMNNFNDKTVTNALQSSADKRKSQESLSHSQTDSKHYSTIGKMNIPPDNFLVHYNNMDYDTAHMPLVDPQSTDLFDFPTTPTKYFNGCHTENSNTYQIDRNCLSNLSEKLAEPNDIELTQSSNDSSNNEQSLLTSPVSHGERKRSLMNGDSTHSVRTSSSSLHKAPVYAKVVKPSSKSSTSTGMSTIERLRLSGSPLRLLSSSPTYARTTSFLKASLNPENKLFQSSSSSIKNNKANSTSWKLNPRKLDSLKARRHSRHTDDDDDDDNTNNNETSQLTMSTTTANRLRHASESDLTNEHIHAKKATKLSSFFQTEV